MLLVGQLHHDSWLSACCLRHFNQFKVADVNEATAVCNEVHKARLFAGPKMLDHIFRSNVIVDAYIRRRRDFGSGLG